MSLPAGNTTKAAGATGTAKVRIVGNNSPNSPAPGDINNCNVDATHAATVTVTSNQPWLTIDAPGSVGITECGNAGEQTIGYSVGAGAPAGGVATISADASGGLSGSLYNDGASGHPEGSFTVTVAGTTPPADGDGDGFNDDEDNCPGVANADQADADGDGVGNLCDPNAFAPAVASNAGNVSGNEGSAINNSGAFSDGDGNGTVTISKQSGAGTVTDYGDGTWSWTHTSGDDASGTVVVQADDGDHAVVTDSFDWQANNVAPTLTLSDSNDTSVSEGSTHTYSYSITDPGTDTQTVVADCGDNGTLGTESAGQFECTFPDGPASSDVSATATDDDGGSDANSTDSQTVTVNNVAPTLSGLTVTGSSSTACLGGNVVGISYTVSDPGDDPFNPSINWGDATTNASSTHTYAAGGPYTISVEGNDGDLGGDATPLTHGPFSFSYDASGILQPINLTGPRSAFKLGSTIPVKIKVADCFGISVGTLAPKVQIQKVNVPGDPDGLVVEATSTSNPTSGSTMRYDATAQQYIYNLATKGLVVSEYRVIVSDPSFGSPVTAIVQLKK